MIEQLTLTLIIFVLLGYSAWSEYQHRQERTKFINALIAKNAQEMRDLSIADKTEIKVAKAIESEYVPTDSINDEAYIKAILNKDSQKEEDGGSDS